jgi:hypothetical protein
MNGILWRKGYAPTISLRSWPNGALRRQRLSTYFVFFGAYQAVMIACRDTPWHGESGKASSGGHITVNFEAPTNKKTPIITHHVYKTNKAYGVKV